MNRRDLLKTLGALAVAASLPKSVAREWAELKVIRDQRFVLHEPFILPFGFDVLIADCSFEPDPDFVGEALLVCQGGNRDVKMAGITTLNMKGRTDIPYAIDVREGSVSGHIYIEHLTILSNDPVAYPYAVSLLS